MHCFPETLLELWYLKHHLGTKLLNLILSVKKCWNLEWYIETKCQWIWNLIYIYGPLFFIMPKITLYQSEWAKHKLFTLCVCWKSFWWVDIINWKEQNIEYQDFFNSLYNVANEKKFCRSIRNHFVVNFHNFLRVQC